LNIYPKITAGILAGGLGTRLRQVVPNHPKVLAPVCNRPFIVFLLDQLIAAKVESAVLCIGYLGEKIKQFLGDKYRSLRLEYSLESEPMGTGGALKLASPFFESDLILVLNGDSYFETDLDRHYQWHFKHQIRASMLLAKVPDVGRYGQVKVTDHGKIDRFEEKNDSKSSGWINAGIYLLAREIIDSIPTNRSVSLEHEIFPKLIDHGLYGFKSKGRFIDIGTPSSFLKAQVFFKNDGENKNEIFEKSHNGAIAINEV
jgi:NDP-sugar pyrophosphorylase family protein